MTCPVLQSSYQEKDKIDQEVSHQPETDKLKYELFIRFSPRIDSEKCIHPSTGKLIGLPVRGPAKRIGS